LEFCKNKQTDEEQRIIETTDILKQRSYRVYLSFVNVVFFVKFYILVKVSTLFVATAIWWCKISCMRHLIKVFLFKIFKQPNQAISKFQNIFLKIHWVISSFIIFNCQIWIIQKICYRLIIICNIEIGANNNFLNPFALNPFLKFIIICTIKAFTSLK